MNGQQTELKPKTIIHNPEINIEQHKADSYRMFDRIYKRYDLLNHLFSLGQDIFWRKKAAQKIKNTAHQSLLDMATGTGDVVFTVLKKHHKIDHAYASDMAFNMLEIAKKKATKKKLKQHVSFIQADASNTPFETSQFNCVTMAFGIRNMPDPLHTLKEIHRILKPKGQLLILEFSLPKHPFIRMLHLFYLRKIIPTIGALISRDKLAYSYLNKTIETFPYGEAFGNIMKDAGFRDVSLTPLTFGVVTLYVGEKKDDQNDKEKR